MTSNLPHSYYVGKYSVSLPLLFILQQAGTNLDFSIDGQGHIIVSQTSFQQAIQDYGITIQVDYDTCHPGDANLGPFSSNRLGPMCKIKFTWINDASPELYEFGILRQGSGYNYISETERTLKPDRTVAMAYAYSVSNDGDPWMSCDRDARIISFRPGP